MRDGKLDPTPVAGTPAVVSLGTMAGLMDIALHPQFAQNKWIYISYHKPMGTAKSVEGRDAPIASNSILRGTWDGKALTDVRDIFVADDIDMEASRITFGPDGMLYMGIGGPGTGSKISMDRAQGTNDLAGKILRMKDDGSVPPDNPFVGKVGYKPYIFSLGHRVQLGLAFNPYTNELWETENGPNGGDELNIIKAGRNYGWPIVSYGRDYNGPRFSPTLAGHGRPARLLGAVDRDRRAWRSTPATSSRAGSATSSSAGCAKAKSRAADSFSASSSTTSGRRCAASRCCANCTSASATSGRGRTDSCIC